MNQKLGKKVTRYFAYSSNMGSEQMCARCPDGEICGPGVLDGYRFIINNRGLATIVPSSDHVVHGVIWKLTPSDEAALDRYEGYRLGLYDKCYREILSGDQTVRTMVYIDHRNVKSGSSREYYLEGIIAGAVEQRLPVDYVQMLRSWPR